ncbi:MAG TPA: GntR family transcriptional regulator [Lactobacillaceae bacterium]|jgi:DNA-binding GntR family transcriptional regulator
MTETIFGRVAQDLKDRIYAGEFATKLKLPDERSLADYYQVSRSSIKRALTTLAQQGIIFKKRGSGTFVNPLYLKNQSLFHYEGSNLGVTDSFRSSSGQAPTIEMLDFSVVAPTPEQQRVLFLTEEDYVYRLQRLRRLNGVPFMIEDGFIPVKILPELTEQTAQESIFNYVEALKKQTVTKSYMSVMAQPSTDRDQQLLELKPNEPVGIMEGIFFLDDGTPMEFSTMRLHYQYLHYNAFVSLDGE